MLLVVGRIGRPHGIRGEVTVEVRTDEPEQRFAAGAVLVTDPAAARAGGRRPADVDDRDGALAPGPAVGALRRRPRPRPRRGRCAACCSASTAPRWRSPADPDEFHDHQLVGLAVVTPSGEPLGEVARIDHAPASDLLVLRQGGRGHRADPVRQGDRARGRPRGRSGRGRPAGWPARPVGGCDARRRRHDLSGVPRAARPVADRQGAGHGPAVGWPSTTCATWTHDVHRTVDDTPYGGGPGMVMRPEPWGQALDALADPVVAAGRADAGRACRSPRRWRRRWPPSRT